MHREVFGDVEDGVEKSDVVALDLATLQETRGVEGAEGGFDFRQRGAEQCQQVVTGNRVTLCEFCVAIALVRLPADSADDPLARVAAEVQDQVADAVRFFIRTPPDLLVRQLLKTALDLRQIVTQQKL